MVSTNFGTSVKTHSPRPLHYFFIMINPLTPPMKGVRQRIKKYQPDSYLVKTFSSLHCLFRRFERVQKQKSLKVITKARKKNDFEKMEAQAKAIMNNTLTFASQCLKIIVITLCSWPLQRC